MDKVVLESLGFRMLNMSKNDDTILSFPIYVGGAS
ncbi:hypothetical protein COLO4_29377 [Corchorus olitorius]|uniref:Uncharacterized protein n=1 Tax=Corchorus olitorius TaxID=93759 RepID=A0A1R3HEW7_9ROSI|nr:hypothetical protein COLO4_29377 [Corchorus olitorius]